MTTNQEAPFEPSEVELLGTVVHVQGDNDSPAFCRLQPTHRQMGESWHAIKNPKLIFPDIGNVFWWHPGARINKGDARRFFVVDQPQYEPGNRRDQFQVKLGSAITPIEIAEVPDSLDLATIRRRIAASEFVSTTPFLGRVLIALPGSPARWIGLFDVDETSLVDSNTFSLVCDTSSGFIRLYQIDPNSFQTIELEGRKHVVIRPGVELSAPEGYFNVQSDAELIKSLANHLRRGAAAEQAYAFRKRIIEESVVALSASGGPSRDRPRDEARLEAAQALGGDAQLSDLEHQQIAQIFDSLPSLEAIRANARQELQAKISDEIESQRRAAQALIDEDKAKADIELTQVRASAKVIKEQAEQTLLETKTALRELIGKAAGAFLENVVVRNLLDMTREDVASDETASSAETIRELSSIDDVSDRVFSITKSRGEDTYLGSALVAILSGAPLVFVAGARADSLAETVARSIGAAGSCVVSVFPTMFSSSDLLNAPTTPIVGLPCRADTFGEFLIRSMKSECLSVVILRGVNRAPPENIVLEFVNKLGGHEEGRWVSWRGANNQIKSIQLDSRVLFLATLVDGPATFRIPDDLGIRTPLVWADRSIVGRQEASLADEENLSVPFEVWKAGTIGGTVESTEPSLARLCKLPRYEALAVDVLGYVKDVSAAISSVPVGVAEALWALTCGRLSDEILRDIAGHFKEDQSRQFCSAIDAGENRRLAKYFDRAEDR